MLLLPVTTTNISVADESFESISVMANLVATSALFFPFASPTKIFKFSYPSIQMIKKIRCAFWI